MVAGFIKGLGTHKSPFDERVREIVRELIKNPRASVQDIKKALEDKTPGISNLRTNHLDEGILSKVVRYRVDLRGLKSPASTCFIRVKLHKKTDDEFRAFEMAINNISGVIEWDQIAGDAADYLVRVVGLGEENLSVKVMYEIETVPNVKEAYLDLRILRSGVVDNFEPDHFFCIEEDGAG